MVLSREPTFVSSADPPRVFHVKQADKKPCAVRPHRFKVDWVVSRETGTRAA